MSAKIIVWSVVLILLNLSAYADQDAQGKSLACERRCVTYCHSEGRFGDNLLAYIHAKWIAYRYNVHMLYRPFIYSDQLALHQEEERFDEREDLADEANPVCFAKKIVVGTGAKFYPHEGNSILYIVPYFPHCYIEHAQARKHTPFFPVDYHNQAFKSELRRMIRPLCEIKELEIPKDRFSVAVHMRKGTRAVDGPSLMFLAPHKEPQDAYYLGQIKRIYALFGNQPLYVHIFTDDPEPQEFVKKFQGLLADLDIQWGARQEGNRHDLNVMDDFFALLDFDCLIRPDSNFSICAEILGNHNVVVSPENVTWETEIPKIGSVIFSIRSEGFEDTP